MFTPTDLSDLLAADPAVAVSAFLPTHVRGVDVRQGPIRLKNLTAAATAKLVDAGLSAGQAEELLAPATALVEDYQFWQHQSLGLAVFLAEGEQRSFSVPIPLEEQVVVGRGYHFTPLLPMLAADGAFRVVSLAAHQSRVFEGSRFGLEPDPRAELPTLATTGAESDYENPVQASPVARPNTGSINIGNAQVYGDSPAEWQTQQLRGLAQAVATAVDALSSRQPLPVVVVADAELGGHFRTFTGLGPLLADVIEVNPESLSDDELHATAYRAVRPRLDRTRQEAVRRFAELAGRGDPRAVEDRRAVARAATQGQVGSLLMRPHPTIWGHYDRTTDRVTEYGPDDAVVEDLYGQAAADTLSFDGTVHVLGEEDLPGIEVAAAILRYAAPPGVQAAAP